MYRAITRCPFEKELKAKGLNVVRVGDAVKSGTIANAVHSAYNTAIKL